jgi:AraC-like DNA-binding protein
MPIRTGFHSHPFWQFDWFINTDKISIELRKERIELSPEMLILIPPEMEHNVLVPGNSIACGIKFDIEKNILPTNKATVIHKKDYKSILEMIFPEKMQEREITAHLLQALLLMIKQAELPLLHDSLKDPRILKALRYMKENIHCNLTRSSLAKQTRMSESHFARLFKKECGMSAIKKMRAIKMEKASELLEYSDYSISQISNMLAFPDLQTFSRFFNNEMGLSPRSFRNKYSIKNSIMRQSNK